MSAASNIITVAVIAIIVISGWTIIMANDFNHSLRTYDESKRGYDIAKSGSDLSAILQITEPTLKLSLADLLGEMAYQRDGNIEYYDQMIDIESKVSEILDSTYGKDNYYLEVVPPAVHIRVVFVIDGSSSLLNDVQSLKEILPAVQDYFKKDFTLETIVYILRFNNDVSCGAVNFGLDVKCIDQNLADFSRKFEDYTVLNLSLHCPKEGVGIYNKYFEDTLKNPVSPFFLGDDQYSIKADGNYICKINLSNDSNRILKGLYYEDWATGTAYAAKDVNLGKINAADSVLTLIFPVSDELSTGSESDVMYTKTRASSGSAAWQQISYLEDRYHLSICDTDAANKRFTRADITIDHAIEVLDDFDYRVFPILTNPQTKLDENTNPKSCIANGAAFHYWYIPPNVKVACCTNPSRPNCRECTENEGFHYQNTIKTEIIKDMEKLATAARGKVIDISGGYNEEALRNSLVSAISGIASKRFTFGTKKEGVERYAINRAIPLRGNRAIEVKFWAYKEKDTLPIDYVSAFELKPVAVANASPLRVAFEWDDLNTTITFWSTSFSPNGYPIVSTQWKEGATILSNAQNFSRLYTRDENGIHNIVLTVADSNGKVASDQLVISIKNLERAT